MTHLVTVYTRVDCSLCAEAIAQVEAITAETGAEWTTVDVDADLDDRAEYGDRVPVILVDGVEHGYYRVEPDRLRRALLG
ncbi:glutaredoxin family protein [Nakamurella sp. GG22]